jgi:hypothetical protein
VEEEAAPEPVAEPEFEVEIDGVPEVIRGADKVKEVLQRGIKAQRTHEENARVREALVAQYQQQEAAAQVQQLLMTDLAELRALDAQLDQWNKVDWAAAFDTDPFQALKLKEQRDSLREQRQSKFQELNGKHSQFVQAQQKAVEQRARAEVAAFQAKVPEWRNPEKAAAEKQAIVRELSGYYGLTPEEIGSVIDHRHLMIARDAVKYRELVRAKADKSKQVRTAPPVVKPGTVQKTPNAKQDFVKVRSHLRKLGATGNSKAQEAAFTELLNGAFKT